MLAPCRTIFPTWDLPEAAGRAGGSVPVGLVGGRMSTPAPLQLTGLLFWATGSPTPPSLSRAGTERPRPPGLKLKPLIKSKKTKTELGERGENTSFRHLCLVFLCDCLLKAGSAGMWESSTPLPLHAPHPVSLTLFVHETHLQPCHVPEEVLLLQATIHIHFYCMLPAEARAWRSSNGTRQKQFPKFLSDLT